MTKAKKRVQKLVAKKWDPSNIMKWTLILGITLVANLFVNYAVEMLQPAPKYDTYCVARSVGDVKVAVPMVTTEVYDQTCNTAYQKDLSVYNRNVFITMTLIGTLVLLLALGAGSVVGVGLAFSGVLMLFTGAMRYWSDMDSFLRVAVLGAALIALLTYGYRKYR